MAPSPIRVFHKVPVRLPATPCLVRECAGSYALWTGRSWFGVVEKLRYWTVSTTGSPAEGFETRQGAFAEALDRAIRAEGGTVPTGT